jgi:flagellar basal body-associated protein FliL
MQIAFPKRMPTGKPGSAQVPHEHRSVVPTLVLLIVLAGAGAWFWINRNTTPAAAQSSNAVISTLHLDTFVLNLADVNQRSYLRVGIDLGLNQEAKHAEETVPVAEVRDTILGVLGEVKVDALMTPAGKTKLKQDLLHALDERLPQLGVEEVYFTEFLIQR